MTEMHEQMPHPDAQSTGPGLSPAGDHSPPARNRTGALLAVGAGSLVLGLILGGVGGFVLGSADSSPTAMDSDAPPAERSESSSQTNATSEPVRDFPGKNVAVEAPGVTLTVLNVEEGPSAGIREEGRRADVAEILTTTAAPGQKFVTIVTEVENTGKTPWDLTCGAAIQATLFDPEERQFAAVDELYRIPENPECNGSTQPGQTVPMSWRYEVPESVVPRYFAFREFGFDYQSDQSLTAIDLDR